MTQQPNNHERLGEAVRTRQERRARWQREGERSLGQNLAMIGALGWTIVVPTLIGIFAGRWLDRYFDMGIFWTLGLLVAGHPHVHPGDIVACSFRPQSGISVSRLAPYISCDITGDIDRNERNCWARVS